jgi:hypothetical protein
MLTTLEEVQSYLILIEPRLNYRIEIIDVTDTGFRLETNYDFSSEKEIALPTTTEILDAEIAKLEDKAYNFEDYHEWMDSCHD